MSRVNLFHDNESLFVWTFFVFILPKRCLYTMFYYIFTEAHLVLILNKLSLSTTYLFPYLI